MAFSKDSISTIINNFRNQIVNFDSKSGHEQLRRFIIPDENGRTDNVFVRQSPITTSKTVFYCLRHSTLSSQIGVNSFFDQIESKPVSKSAMSQRRTRLDPGILNHLNGYFLNQSYGTFALSLARWNNWFLLACDGSEFALPDTDAIASEFGRYKCKDAAHNTTYTFPMAKCMMISDVLNGFTLKAHLYPYRTNESVIFGQMLKELVEDAPLDLHQSIFILDRGYFSLKLMYDMMKLSLIFVIRIPTKNKIVKDFIASGKREAVVEWSPSENTSLGRDSQWVAEGKKPLKIRLVQVELNTGEIEVLATNLTPEQVDVQQMKELYFKRWGIEVEYLHYKHVYQIEAFSGGRPICIYQDFYAVVLCHNIACLIIDSQKEAVEQQNKSKKIQYKTNVAIFVGIFYNLFIKMIVLDYTDQCLEELYHAGTKYLTPINENRHYMRKRRRYRSSDRNLTRTNRKRVC